MVTDNIAGMPKPHFTERGEDGAARVKLDMVWTLLGNARENNPGKWRMVDVNEPEPMFTCDGVILDFFQAGILDELKKSSHGKMAYVLDDVTAFLNKNGLVEVGHYPSRDGRLCTLTLTDRSRNHDISPQK